MISKAIQFAYYLKVRKAGRKVLRDKIKKLRLTLALFGLSNHMNFT